MNDLAKTRLLMTSSLMQAGRQWRRLAQEVVAAHGVSEAQAAPLVWVHRLGGGVRQVTLAGHVGIEGTSLVRLLDQLSGAGLLERRDDPEDRRAKTIWLTEAGERLAARIEMALAELRDRIFADVSDEDIEATTRVLRALNRTGDQERAADREKAAPLEADS